MVGGTVGGPGQGGKEEGKGRTGCKITRGSPADFSIALHPRAQYSGCIGRAEPSLNPFVDVVVVVVVAAAAAAVVVVIMTVTLKAIVTITVAITAIVIAIVIVIVTVIVIVMVIVIVILIQILIVIVIQIGIVIDNSKTNISVMTTVMS